MNEEKNGEGLEDMFKPMGIPFKKETIIIKDDGECNIEEGEGFKPS
jgi:hypothetical protein